MLWINFMLFRVRFQQKWNCLVLAVSFLNIQLYVLSLLLKFELPAERGARVRLTHRAVEIEDGYWQNQKSGCAAVLV